jgi:putative SOS response-associated peptidase YedK
MHRRPWKLPTRHNSLREAAVVPIYPAHRLDLKSLLIFPKGAMCGRIIQSSAPLRLAIVDGLDVRDSRLTNVPRRYNAAPRQDLLIIRRNPRTGERSLEPITWGLIPSWSRDPKGGRRPINVKAETITSSIFRDTYRLRRCIVPVDGFFEWQATKDGKQPYAVAMKNGAPFGLAGLWENWKSPSGEWVRTFAVITVATNTLLARIHDRMPAILRPEDYEVWLGPDADPRDVLVTFPSEPMRMWPISQRVNSFRNDDAALLDPVG